MDFIYLEERKSLHLCGIYQIRNTINDKKYVGSSLDIYHRTAKHKCLLLRNQHNNNHLQSSVNKYGLDVFEVSVLEICDQNHLVSKERFWISKLQVENKEKGYNKCQVSDSRRNVVSEDTKRKISKNLMGNQVIKMFDKISGELIADFESLYDAAAYIQESGFSSGFLRNIRIKISEAIRGKKVSTGLGRIAKRSTAYGYKWEV